MQRNKQRHRDNDPVHSPSCLFQGLLKKITRVVKCFGHLVNKVWQLGVGSRPNGKQSLSSSEMFSVGSLLYTTLYTLDWDKRSVIAYCQKINSVPCSILSSFLPGSVKGYSDAPDSIFSGATPIST